MKKIIYSYVFIFLMCFIFVDKVNSQTKTVIEVVSSIINIKLPAVSVNNQKFIEGINDIILSDKLHTGELFEDNIYCIDIQQNITQDKSIIYVSLLPAAAMDNYIIKGCFRINGILFLFAGDNHNNLFTVTEKMECLQYKKIIGYIENGEFNPNPILEMRDSPIWICTYENNKLELFRKDFIPGVNNKIQ